MKHKLISSVYLASALSFLSCSNIEKSFAELFNPYASLEKKLLQKVEESEETMAGFRKTEDDLEKITGTDFKSEIEVEVTTPNKDSKTAYVEVDFKYQKDPFSVGLIASKLRFFYNKHAEEILAAENPEYSKSYFIFNSDTLKDYESLILAMTEKERRKQLYEDVSAKYEDYCNNSGKEFSITCDAFIDRYTLENLINTVKKQGGELDGGIIFSDHSKYAVVGVETWRVNKYSERYSFMKLKEKYFYSLEDLSWAEDNSISSRDVLNYLSDKFNKIKNKVKNFLTN